MGITIAPRGGWWAARNYLLGICLGGTGALLFWNFYPGFWKESLANERAIAVMDRRAALLAEADSARATSESAATPAPRTACSFEPLIPPGSTGDGRARMEHPFPASAAAKAKVFLRAATKAAARGHPRDEEVALIAACRANDEASTAPTVPLARVLGVLGERYAVATAVESDTHLRAQLFARAGEMLTRSADAYAQALGPNAPRSREARMRVDGLAEAILVRTDAAQSREPTRPAAAVHALPRQDATGTSTRAVAAPHPHPTELPAHQPIRPNRPLQSSVPDTAPASREPRHAQAPSDPELRQLASDLGRLRAQAEAVSEDPPGLRRRAERTQAQRAQCLDTACVRAWYARRRQELLAEF